MPIGCRIGWIFFPPKKQEFYYMLHSTSLKENSFHKWCLQEAKVPLHKHAIRAMKIRVINTLAASRQQILIASSGKKKSSVLSKPTKYKCFWEPKINSSFQKDKDCSQILSDLFCLRQLSFNYNFEAIAKQMVWKKYQ